MNRLTLFSLLAAAGLFGVGCEMHPPSETVEGYAEKEAAKKQAETQPEGAAPGAAKYFND